METNNTFHTCPDIAAQLSIVVYSPGRPSHVFPRNGEGYTAAQAKAIQLSRDESTVYSVWDAWCLDCYFLNGKGYSEKELARHLSTTR